jgi:hypothetical protein
LGELTIGVSIDFGSLPEEKTAVGYLGSGSLKVPSEPPLLAIDEAHIIPKTTARLKKPLLCIELELSLFRTY